MARRVLPAEAREGMRERLKDLESRQIPQVEQESAAGDVSAFALLQMLRQERNQLLDALRAEPEEGTWDTRRIEVGDAVVVCEVGRNEDEHFLLVPAGAGSRAEDGWVSEKAPLGVALVGAGRGEIIKVAAPAGVRRYLVVDFRAA